MLETEIKILDVKLQIGEDELADNDTSNFSRTVRYQKKNTHLFSDLLPDDARHLIAIEFDNWVVHHDLLFWKGGEGTIECGLQK